MNGHQTTTTRKCANDFCSNHVIDNKYSFCLACFKAYKADQIAAATERAAADAKRLQTRILRSELLTEYKSDKLRDGAVVIAEKEGAHVVISLGNVKHVFDDRGDVVARKFARQRAIQRANEAAAQAEAQLKSDLLSEFQAGKLRDGAKVTATNGPLVSIAFAGKSYTICDRDGEKRRAEEARAKAEQERQAAIEKARRAEEEKARQAAEIAAVFAQIKKSQLDPGTVVEHNGRIIHVLLPDDRELTFEDPDVLAAEAQARKDAEAVAKAARKSEQKSKGKSEGKKEGKQRKAA